MATLITCWLHARTLHFPELQNMSILGLRNDKNDSSYSYILQTHIYTNQHLVKTVLSQRPYRQRLSRLVNWSVTC